MYPYFLGTIITEAPQSLVHAWQSIQGNNENAKGVVYHCTSFTPTFLLVLCHPVTDPGRLTTTLDNIGNKPCLVTSMSMQNFDYSIV